jgi:hypothetical protein
MTQEGNRIGPQTESLHPEADEIIEKSHKEHRVPQRLWEPLKEAFKLLSQGSSLRYAASKTGVNYMTLSRYWNRSGLEVKLRQSGGIQLIADQAVEISKEAGSQLLERLQDPEEKMTTRELSTLYGISVDKVVRLEGGQEAPQDRFTKALSAVAEATKAGEKTTLTVTLEKEGTSNDDEGGRAESNQPVIDVTPLD